MIKLLFLVGDKLQQLQYQKWNFPGGEIGIKLPVDKIKELNLGQTGWHISWLFDPSASEKR